MEPTLFEGDILLVKPVDAPKRGEVPDGVLVVCQLPGGRPLAVKRLVGWLDGGWWVERDNPREGVDSVLCGSLEPGAIKGIVVRRIWRKLSSLLKR